MNIKIVLAPVALSLLGISACAPTSQLQLSSGRIGCATSDLVIGDVASSGKSESWSATCQGQTYFCSATSDFREVICRPQLKAAALPPPVAPASVVAAPVAAPPAIATPAEPPAAPAAPAAEEAKPALADVAAAPEAAAAPAEPQK